MTQAYNLSQLANNLDSSGRLDASDGLVNAVPIANGGTGATTAAGAASALQAEIGKLMYPVGSIYINATSSTNPATLLGFGTWVAFGAGRVPVSYNAGDPSFNTAEGTGGSKDAIVVSHSHTASTLGNQTGITATTPIGSGNGSETRHSQRTLASGYAATGGIVTITDPGHDHTTNISTTGSSGTNANLPPYIVVYMWKRTA